MTDRQAKQTEPTVDESCGGGPDGPAPLVDRFSGERLYAPAYPMAMLAEVLVLKGSSTQSHYYAQFASCS